MPRLVHFAAAGAGALLLGALALGLAGYAGPKPESTVPNPALEREVAELRRENDDLKAALTTARNQLHEMDRALGATRTEWAELLQEHKALQAQSRERTDALKTAELRLSDADAELARLRRELFELRMATPEAPAAREQSVEQMVSVNTPPATAPNTSKNEQAARLQSLTVLQVSDDGRMLAIDHGSRSGARQGQHLTLSDGAKPVASVVLTAVRADFSVGTVNPDNAAPVLRPGVKLFLLSAEQ